MAKMLQEVMQDHAQTVVDPLIRDDRVREEGFCLKQGEAVCA